MDQESRKDDAVGETNASADESRQPLASIEQAYAGKLMPGEQVHLFRNTHRAFPCRRISRGDGPVADLPQSASMIEDLPIRADGQEFDLYDYVSRNRLVGLLMMKDGKVVHERYELGIDASTRWMSMSMAKSVSTLLIGIAIRDGFIGGVDDMLTDYLPGLRGSGYDGVSIRHLMQMTSGVEWDDTHTDSRSHRRHMLDLQIGQEPDRIMTYMASLPRIAEPGTLWNYSTGETHVVGALVKAATGHWLADYASDKIWSRLGMEADAAWWLESPDGLEVAGSGICATLRDYARLGLFAMNDGRIEGEQVLPAGWIEESTVPREAGGNPLNYGYMWWPVPDAAGSFADGAFSARGIFGQYIYVNPAERVVLTVLSARSKPKFAEAILDNHFFNSAVEALR
ncbi:serine hydrolase domain-containing protein [Pelagerythrobacter marensis]|uniref:serine hydrolase domain-containing protein n=1 Tax=Pelagerythrobacter marensis TaxID=543877 RepID=UPI0006498538|nr:serine hydrolase [Pelagerythrobacter marensis]